MRRNPALLTIIMCVAPPGLAAQSPEGISHDRGQLELSLQNKALGQHTDHPSTLDLKGSHQQNVPAQENDRLQEPEIPSQRIGSERPVPELLTEAGQRPAMGLKDFEDLALTNNPALKQAKELVRRAAGQAQQAGLGRCIAQNRHKP